MDGTKLAILQSVVRTRFYSVSCQVIHPTATVSANSQQDLVRNSFAVTAAMMSVKFSISNVLVKSVIAAVDHKLDDETQRTPPSHERCMLPTDWLTAGRGFLYVARSPPARATASHLHNCQPSARQNGRGRILHWLTSRNVYVGFSRVHGPYSRNSFGKIFHKINENM